MEWFTIHKEASYSIKANSPEEALWKYMGSMNPIGPESTCFYVTDENGERQK